MRGCSVFRAEGHLHPATRVPLGGHGPPDPSPRGRRSAQSFTGLWESRCPETLQPGTTSSLLLAPAEEESEFPAS